MIKQSRENFIEFINDTLNRFGFIKESDGERWILNHDIQTGGSVVVVNGQRINNPGEIHHIEFNIEVVGNGSMKDTDSNIEEEFIEIDFYAIENEIRQDITPTMCMYFDDNNEFNELINNILRR